MSVVHEPRFSMLQRKAQDAANADWQWTLTLTVKYGTGGTWRCSRAEQRKRDQLTRASSKAFDRMFAELAKISPRDWSQYVPTSWIRDKLTYSDACTASRLSVVPDCAFGATVADLERFAQPVRSECAK